MNAERSEMVVARLDAGATMQEIATELGVSRQRVGQLASAHPGYSGRGGRDARQEIATEAAAAAVEAGAVVTDIDRNAWRRLSPEVQAAARRNGMRRMRQLRTVEEGRAEAEVFAGIRRAAARVASGALSRTAYDRLRDPDDLSSIRIGQRWGWVEACKLAGVTPGGRYAGAGAPRVWSAEQCEALVSEYAATTDAPGVLDLGRWLAAEPGRPSLGTIRNRVDKARMWQLFKDC